MKRVIIAGRQDIQTEIAWAVTYGWDEGGPESGPIWKTDTDVIYARSADEACRIWEAEFADQFDIYEGCSARPATAEEIQQDKIKGKEFEELPFY